jgi:hypothetical protein
MINIFALAGMHYHNARANVRKICKRKNIFARRNVHREKVTGIRN